MSRYVLRYGYGKHRQTFEADDILELEEIVHQAAAGGLDIEATRNGEPFDVRPLSARGTRATKNPGRV